MDRPHGRIIELIADAAPRRAVVEVESSMRCPRCAAGKGCGAGLLGGDGRLHRIAAVIPDDLELQPGDSVRLELAPRDLLQAATLAYGAPLVGVLAFAGAATIADLGDLPAVLLTLLGGIVGFATGRARLRGRECRLRLTPTVAGRLAAGED